MVWMEELDKAGFYYVNDDNFNEELYDVHCYDISSAFLSFLLRKKFPSTHFTYTDDDDEIQEIISKKFYCWYGLFRFKKLQYREDVNFHIDLTRFGSPVEGGDMCEWDILFTNVDIEWFKQVFTWDDCYAIGIFYAEQKELNKNYALMFDELYENKDSQIKGTFAKEIHKFRAELPYGNPIKALDYATEIIYNAETNSYEEVEKEKPRSFKQKIAKLK